MMFDVTKSFLFGIAVTLAVGPIAVLIVYRGGLMELWEQQ